MINGPRIGDTDLVDMTTRDAAAEADLVGEADSATPTPLERAETLCGLQRFGDALDVVGKVIADDPRNATAWCLMARAHLGIENATAALKAAEAASSLASGDERPHLLASTALSRLDRDEEAVLAAREAIRCAPTSWQGHARLAHCLTSFRDRLGDAQAAADQALALGPDDSGPHMAAGAVALAAGRRDDAAAAFCSALVVDPLCNDAHNQLAGMPARRREPVRHRLGALMSSAVPPFGRRGGRAS